MKTKKTLGAETLIVNPVSLIERILLKYTNAILEEMQELHAKYSKTKNRLQVLREAFTSDDWEAFLAKHPQASDWFDENNIPKTEARGKR